MVLLTIFQRGLTMKRSIIGLLAILALVSAFALTSCKDDNNDKDPKTDGDVAKTDADIETPDPDVVPDEETPDPDVVDIDVPADEDTPAETEDDVIPSTCSLEDALIEGPVGTADAWVTLRMIGNINDAKATEIDSALISDGTLHVGGKDGAVAEINGTATGMYIADSSSGQDVIYAIGQGNLRWVEPNKIAKVAYTQAVIPKALLTAMKKQPAETAEFSPTIMVQDIVFELRGTDQDITQICWVALSKFEKVEENGETYDVPKGSIKACIADNKDFVAGEKLKLAMRGELMDKDEDIKAFFESQNQPYQKCTCYEYGSKQQKEIPCPGDEPTPDADVVVVDTDVVVADADAVVIADADAVVITDADAVVLVDADAVK